VPPLLPASTVRTMNHALFRLVLLALLIPTAPLSAQPAVEAEAGIYSSYLSRGLIATSRPVAQGALEVTVPRGALAVSLGAWANLELATYDSSREISMAGGEQGPNLTELDLHAGLTRQVGSSALTVGALAYLFPTGEGSTSEDDTAEVFATLGLDLPFAPELSIYYDVHQVRGAYLEGSASHEVAIGGLAPVTFGVVVGYSAGQGENLRRPTELAYFAGEGLTHVELSASTELGFGSVLFRPGLHVSLGVDPHTRISAAGEESRAIVWFGGNVTWNRPGADR
jgi:hypothetical protein